MGDKVPKKILMVDRPVGVLARELLMLGLVLGEGSLPIMGDVQLDLPRPDLSEMKESASSGPKLKKKKRGSAGCSHKSRRCTGSLRLCFTCDEKNHKKKFVCSEHQCRICKKCPLHCLRRNFDPPHDFEPS